jgi:23S rRNA U2552 (ribose-2'-O)-methylase RlmE/FtsJ
MATLDQLRAVKRKYSADLLKKPGVIGVDIQVKKSGEAVIIIHLDSQDTSILSQLPTDLDGFTVKYFYTGPVRKQDEKP